MNNSATTRVISKVAFEYNGNDKGMARATASNFLLSSKPEDQYQEMKVVADRNPKVKKWALTGYISPPEEAGKIISDSELTDIAIEALHKIGVTDKNQYRLDIHNSTKQKHIHFIVNRINISGKCTVKAHDIGERFGKAVRQVCKERNLKTDIEIGIEKKDALLKNLTESLRESNNFDELIAKMNDRNFELQLSTNVKDGISGMRIILKSDINHATQRQYKAGYKLSEISTVLKIAEIKNIFEIKNAIHNELNTAANLKEFRENLYRKGWSITIRYKAEFNENKKKQVTDIWINKAGSHQLRDQKTGFFFKKGDGFSLSAIDSDFANLLMMRDISGEEDASVKPANSSTFKTVETIGEIVEELIDDVLTPHYVSQEEDEWWKKKRKSRR